MVPNALHRPAPVHGVDVFDFELLPCFPEGALPENLDAVLALSPAPDGAGDWTDHYQYSGGPGGAGGQANVFCTHSQVPGRVQARQGWRKEISQAAGVGSLDRVGDRWILRLGGLLCDR